METCQTSPSKRENQNFGIVIRLFVSYLFVRGDFLESILLERYFGPIVSYLESSSGSIEASIVIARTSSWILLELPVLSGSMLNKLSKTELKVLVPFGSWSHLIKFRYSEKTATIWKNLPLFLTLLGDFKKSGRFFKNNFAFSQYLNFTIFHV